MLKLWRLSDSLRSGNSVVGSNDVLLVAEFISCFAARIMCLDVSVEEEVFVSHLFFHIVLLNKLCNLTYRLIWYSLFFLS